MLNEYRVTKYSPDNRNELGHYLDGDEWTEFFQVGDQISLEEYENVESAYIESAIEFLLESGIPELKVVDLENYQKISDLSEGSILQIEELPPHLKSMLRGYFWCGLESKLGFIHIGWDFYMYLGVTTASESAIKNAAGRGLYVEKFLSPYHPENS